ncbi:MAG: transketolase [Alphaproteobacteria bacterium]
MNIEKKQEIDKLCLSFRRDLIETLHAVQTGHPGGSLSVAEILTTIYFNEANITPENITDRNRDKIVLCKGHAAPMLYLILAQKGFFAKSELKTLRQINSNLQGHPCVKKTKGVEVSTGPLGAGFPFALGLALSDTADNIDAYTYAILGDGEINEGVIWETCLNAAKFKANRLITILDWNGVQLDGTTNEILPMGDVELKFKAFGFNTIICDGHNAQDISDAINKAKAQKDMPSIILAKTIKGKGVSFMEGKNIWHGAPINDELYAQAMQELEGEK